METIENSLSNNRVPKVSVISIAISADEFKPTIEQLKLQTYQDIEFIGEAGGSIPEAWNRAIQRAKGEIIVFTETDARAINEYWLEEMVTGVSDPKTIVKGLEITSTSIRLSNLAVHREVMVNNPFTESFRWIADIELFSRLKEKGFHITEVPKAVIINLSKAHNQHAFKRAFLYGFYWGRLRRRFVDPVEIPGISFAYNRLKVAVYQLCGMAIGAIIYLPERRKRIPYPLTQTVE